MLKKPGLEELVRELEKDYARWEQVYMAGSKDPFWPDGVNEMCIRDRYKALGNSVAVPCVETVLAAVQNYLRWEEKD